MRRTLGLMAVSGLLAALFGQTAARVAAVPADPLELASGPVQVAATPADRNAALELLGRARNQFALRTGGPAYHLKVHFTVDSEGQTNYDGAWQMEDLYAPGQGVRWTATAEAGYTTTRISAHGKNYAEGTANAIPLRLNEARGLLMDPLPSPAYADRGSIRTASATFHGAQVSCLLLARQRNPANPPVGRGWEESEECIDPKTGLLVVHSEVPGRYALFDYSNAPQIGGHMLPGTVTVTEGGRTVSKISVDSLTQAAPDASRFVPSDAMKAAGEPIAIASATKVSRVNGAAPVAPATTVRTVCVFGVVTPAGQLAEAHSLQPGDANSAAALADARSIDFAASTPAGAAPEQHFVFVIEKFTAAR